MIFQGSNSTSNVAAIVFVLLILKVSSAAAQVRDEGIIAQGPIVDYIGSNACLKCHQDKFENLSAKQMSHFVSYRGDASEPLPGNWRNSPIKANDVFLIVGSKKKVAFVDKNWKVLPFQYHIKKQKWGKRPGWSNQDYRVRCGPCHMVGVNPKTKTFVEINVGCEACHGPGKKHTEVPEQNELKVPGKTDENDMLFTCRRCHNNRRNHARAIEGFKGLFHGKAEF